MLAQLCEAGLNFKRGTGAFGSTVAPEDAFGEGTHRFALWTANVQWRQPFELGAQRWQYQGQWRGQSNRTPLTPQDRFAIGGRYTVRGFDGQSSLSAERGWFIRMRNVHQRDAALQAGERSIADVQNFGRSVIITTMTFSYFISAVAIWIFESTDTT